MWQNVPAVHTNYHLIVVLAKSVFSCVQLCEDIKIWCPQSVGVTHQSHDSRGKIIQPLLPPPQLGAVGQKEQPQIYKYPCCYYCPCPHMWWEFGQWLGSEAFTFVLTLGLLLSDTVNGIGGGGWGKYFTLNVTTGMVLHKNRHSLIWGQGQASRQKSDHKPQTSKRKAT